MRTLPKRGAVLHAGKDLAVSPAWFPKRLLLNKMMRSPFTFDPGVSARTSGLAADGRYPLPCSTRRWACPDFPPVTCVNGQSPCSGYYATFTKICNYSTGSTTSSPIAIVLLATNPAFASTTNQAGVGEENDSGNDSGVTFSSMCTISPSSATQRISSA